MKNKKLSLVLVAIFMMFILTGCTMPRNPDGSTKLIEATTTWKYMFENEGFFQAILVYPLSQLVRFFTTKTGNVFLGITLVTALVHTAVAAATFKSQMAQTKMQMIQPELAKIQKKYEGKTDNDSKARMAQEMQMLYKKHDVNPLGSIGSLFLQFPILISIYYAVQRCDIVVNGTFATMQLNSTPLQGIKGGNFVYAVVFALMILFQFISTQIPMFLNERRAKAEAAKHFRRYEKQPNQAAGMTYGMIAMVAIFGLSWPTSMSVYWIISSIVNIIKTLVMDALMHKEGK